MRFEGLKHGRFLVISTPIFRFIHPYEKKYSEKLHRKNCAYLGIFIGLYMEAHRGNLWESGSLTNHQATIILAPFFR